MSTRFHYTKESIAGLALRHTDSGLSRIKVNSKFNTHQIDTLDRLRELQTRRRASIYHKKQFEYSKEHQIVLPTAPALRCLPKEKVARIVNRLYPLGKETDQSHVVPGCHYCSRANTKRYSHTQQTGSTETRCPHCSRELIKTKHISRSQEYISDMVERLSTTRISESDFETGRFIRFPSLRNIPDDNFDRNANFGSLMSDLDEETAKPFTLSVIISPSSKKSRDDLIESQNANETKQTLRRGMKSLERRRKKSFKTFKNDLPKDFVSSKAIVPKDKTRLSPKHAEHNNENNESKVILPAVKAVKTHLIKATEIPDVTSRGEFLAEEKEQTKEDESIKPITTNVHVPTKMATHEDIAFIMKNRRQILRSAYSAENIPRTFISPKARDEVSKNKSEHETSTGPESNNGLMLKLNFNKKLAVDMFETPRQRNSNVKENSVNSNSNTNTEHEKSDSKLNQMHKADNTAVFCKSTTHEKSHSPRTILKSSSKITEKHVTYSDGLESLPKSAGFANLIEIVDEKRGGEQQNTKKKQNRPKRDVYSSYSNSTRFTV